MSEGVDSSTALLTEHLRYTPVSLIDDVINSINTISYRAVDWVEQGLTHTPLSNLGFSDPTSGSRNQSETEALEAQIKHEIDNGAHQLETLLGAAIDKNFDKLEIYALRNIIFVPDDLKDWVRLRHYEGLTFSTSPDAPSIESITLQLRKYHESQRLHRLLQAEAARNAALIKQLRSVLSPTNTSSHIVPKPEPRDAADAARDDAGQPPYPTFTFLTQKGALGDSSATTPLSTTTAFALSQIPSLKALLAELRPAIETLSGRPATTDQETAEGGNGNQSWRRQRLEYVETQTRKFHERVRGLELGPQGEVRDGEWQDQGRKIGLAEVEALERVVALVGGNERDEMDE